ncbi:50S ribosomal protein L15 [Luteithermobacter gelatinilyticus]|uniref:50S ribosomal protein L15 n=1 Tax=Luteithermobacter gelatinilyticus TaxID=2582913 RepID=UPI001106FEF9|nr:50S ribosomal protein L15 [Luteithermobacter gelatinilyticus]
MKLNEIANKPGATKARTRIGRGIGSGKGKTGGRGVKGQKSRSGVAIKGFEGGQMPIHMRLPKRGFNNISRKTFVPLNIGRLQEAIDAKKLDAKKPITIATLKEAGLVKNIRDGIRLLAKGELKAKVDIEVSGASAAAIKAVEAAGGKVTVLASEHNAAEDAKTAEA